MKTLRVHLLNENAKPPEYAHDDDSGMDIFSTVDIRVPSIMESLIRVGYDPYVSILDHALNSVIDCYVPVPTGLSIEIPEGYELQVRPKSGLALKYGITVLNTPGTVDEGFRGEIQVLLLNLGSKDYEVTKGQKIAQLVLAPVERAKIVVMDDGQRKTGGFGSTGLKSESSLVDALKTDITIKQDLAVVNDSSIYGYIVKEQ